MCECIAVRAFEWLGLRYTRTAREGPCECIAVRAPAPPSLCECIAVRAKRRPRLRYIRTAPHSPCECIAVRAPRSSKTGHFLHTDLQEVTRKSFKIVLRLISETAPPVRKRIQTRPLLRKRARDGPPKGPPPKLPQSGLFQ